ncbi:hypothetical protein OTK49_02785 [Vibrio coralliirubri]|uniref:hypothetical protein n=1 Tax=Vibrio coralliirubri TaxID=1516159 RepID=UPI002283E237|nr:hypothetical protein [Vibrio coralliirubri]MCY9861444.1 hypothetical protein [Vibrio coralliirubri]
MQTINPSDYFDANLLDGKAGKMSSDQSKIRFGDLCVDVSGDFTSSTLDGNEVIESNPDDAAKNSFLEEFTPSAPVVASVYRHSGENGELHWLLAIATPMPKNKIPKDKSQTHYVTVLGCGTVAD